jgi:predicted nucleic acid-binding protein
MSFKYTLVDTNVLLDIITKDPNWSKWSGAALEEAANSSLLAINPIIYAELSVAIPSIEELEQLFPTNDFHYLPLLKEVAFLAGKAFVKYRRKGGEKRSPLPDFFIGAHAALLDIPLVTRDVNRYKTYFPKLNLIHPK